MNQSTTFLSLSVVFPLRLQQSQNTHRSTATLPISFTERSVSAAAPAIKKSHISAHIERDLTRLICDGALVTLQDGTTKT